MTGRDQAADSLVLTDDEVAAVATAAGALWPVGLPTVPGGDEDALWAASFRGHRSFLARGMLTSEGTLDASVSDVVSQLAGSDSLVLAYLGDDVFRRAGWALSSAHYPSGSAWTLETVTSVGIHRFSDQPLVQHRVYFEALLASARDAGPTASPDTSAPPEPVWLCLLAAKPPTAILSVARRDEVRFGEVTIVDGRVVVLGELAFADPSTAVEALLAPFAFDRA